MHGRNWKQGTGNSDSGACSGRSILVQGARTLLHRCTVDHHTQCCYCRGRCRAEEQDTARIGVRQGGRRPVQLQGRSKRQEVEVGPGAQCRCRAEEQESGGGGWAWGPVQMQGRGESVMRWRVGLGPSGRRTLAPAVLCAVEGLWEEDEHSPRLDGHPEHLSHEVELRPAPSKGHLHGSQYSIIWRHHASIAQAPGRLSGEER